MGHWGTCPPLTSNNLFCSASLWNYRPTKYDGNLFEKYLQDLRTAVIKINQLIFHFIDKNEKCISGISLSRCISKPYFVLLYVRELFRCRFVPLLEPNPGDANVVTQTHAWCSVNIRHYCFPGSKYNKLANKLRY